MLQVPRQDSGSSLLFSPRHATSEESLFLSQSTEGFLGDIVTQARGHILGPTKTMVDIAKKRSSHMTDVELGKYGARAQKKKKEKKKKKKKKFISFFKVL
jgi:hypothetical protein